MAQVRTNEETSRKHLKHGLQMSQQNSCLLNIYYFKKKGTIKVYLIRHLLMVLMILLEDIFWIFVKHWHRWCTMMICHHKINIMNNYVMKYTLYLYRLQYGHWAGCVEWTYISTSWLKPLMTSPVATFTQFVSVSGLLSNQRNLQLYDYDEKHLIIAAHPP